MRAWAKGLLGLEAAVELLIGHGRLRVEGGPDQFVFAKLYTKGHVRADRWYKLWRTSCAR